MVKLHILVDNRNGKQLNGEHGLSLFVEAEINILFDSGKSDLFLHNAQRMGLDLKRLSAVILSHGHDDHGNGFRFIKGYRLFAHPLCFARRFNKEDGSYCGLSYDRGEAARLFSLQLSKKPVWISPSIIFLGEIPRVNDFEGKTTKFIDEKCEEDYLPDDSAIAIKTESGLLIVTGCSHSGICNIAVHAQKITGSQYIHSIVGGLHLMHDDEATKKTVEMLQQMQVKTVLPLHCIGKDAFTEFRNAFGSPIFNTGDTICIP